MANKLTATNKNPAQRQQALDRLKGNPEATRRPLIGYETFYEIAADGAIFSVRLKRFLKPVFDAEKGTAVLEFEHNGKTERLSPGKAIALSYFNLAQRKRVVSEAVALQPYDTIDKIKGHPALAVLSKKYGVASSAIFYIMLAALAKPTPTKPPKPGA
jgi:hypothetical protein